ncbi:hypothetical protein MTR67_040361 [Solanum verrucosum]|uniref:Uncharacterized protein n=1 Tax=Solanum verrucosum TaxID=315347 RepID=A0AAF0UKF8_SOLVR|nr:hypothetical protein MTR67_040361 [Solanum verrucosum]
MAATTSGQPHPEAGLLIVPKGHSYVHSLRRAIKPIPLKPLTYLHGEPQEGGSFLVSYRSRKVISGGYGHKESYTAKLCKS